VWVYAKLTAMAFVLAAEELGKKGTVGISYLK